MKKDKRTSGLIQKSRKEGVERRLEETMRVDYGNHRAHVAKRRKEPGIKGTRVTARGLTGRRGIDGGKLGYSHSSQAVEAGSTLPLPR